MSECLTPSVLPGLESRAFNDEVHTHLTATNGNGNNNHDATDKT